jgi:hypothetical protein
MIEIDTATAALRELTESLAPEESREVLLDRVTAQVVALLPGADAVSVTLVESGGPATVAATDDALTVLDTIQYGADDGPCLHALRTRSTVRADIADAGVRWPRFAHEATEAGIRTVLSCPMFLPAHGAAGLAPGHAASCSGALTVWSVTASAFNPVETALTAMFTTAMSAVILTAARWAHARVQTRQLLVALENRDVIATAKGIVMARADVDADTAFRWLVDVSQRTNRKLRDVAELIISDPGVVNVASTHAAVLAEPGRGIVS